MPSAASAYYVNNTSAPVAVAVNRDLGAVITVPAPSWGDGGGPGTATGGYNPSGPGAPGELRPGQNILLVELGQGPSGPGQFHEYSFALPAGATAIVVSIFASDVQLQQAALIVLADGVPANGASLRIISGYLPLKK